MKVKELIEILLELDQEKEIVKLEIDYEEQPIWDNIRTIENSKELDGYTHTSMEKHFGDKKERYII